MLTLLQSAGQTIKIVAYAVGLLGLIVSACLYIHVRTSYIPCALIRCSLLHELTIGQIAAKYIFVRILRNSRHLQSNTVIHWMTWLGCTYSIGAISFIYAEGIPIFNYVTALTGSVCFAPIAIVLPGWLWIYDHAHYRTGQLYQKVIYWLHAALVPFGVFFLVGGTYGVALQISEAYSSGTIGEYRDSSFLAW